MLRSGARTLCKGIVRSRLRKKAKLSLGWADWKNLRRLFRKRKVASLIDRPETNASEKKRYPHRFGRFERQGVEKTLLSSWPGETFVILPEVYAQYQDLTLSFNHIKSAVIYSAYPLTDKQVGELAQMLNKRFDSELKISVSQADWRHKS